MRISLEGRVAVVTGARQGIGAAIAGALLESGASVVITGRDSAQLAQSMRSISVSHQGDLRGFVGNVADEADIDRLVREVPRIDILVNNAGAFCGPLTPCSPHPTNGGNSWM